MKRRARVYLVRTVLLGLWLSDAGCASSRAPAFDPRFPENESARTAAVLHRLPAPAPLASSSVLVATTQGATPELIAYDLAQARVRFRIAIRAESRPELLGDLVVTTAQGRVLGFDLMTGAAKLNTPLGDCAYLGSAGDGERVYSVCRQPAASPGAQPTSLLTAIDARSGRVLWKHAAQGELGRPAATAGLVLVPWQEQNLCVLDARDGTELARLRSHDDVIDFVRADARGTFFGQRALRRLSADYRASDPAAPKLRVRTDELPGRPPMMESAFAVQPASRSARGRIALYLEPEAVDDGNLRIAHDRYYLSFYRYVFAYDGSGALLWARMLTHDVVAGQAIRDGVVIASEEGSVHLLSREVGSVAREWTLGRDLASANLDAAGLQGSGASAGAAVSLRTSLTQIALDTDNRLVPARTYAVTELAKLSEPDVTRDLLDIYAQSTTPPELARVLSDALRARRTGLEHLIDALALRYDYLEQTRPAPLAVIVPALVDAHETRAVPRLIDRMLDHETPLAVLPTVVRAVVELGDDSVLEPLLSFARLYRSDSSFAAQPDALIEAARGVLLHGGEQGPSLLAGLVQDGRATTAFSSKLAALGPPRPSQEATPSETRMAEAEKRAALPEELSQQAVDGVFAEHVDEVRSCVIDELGRNPKLALLRVAFIAESEGSIHALSFAPNTPQLVDCLYPKIAAYRFPPFKKSRVVASYRVSVRPHTNEEANEPTKPSAEHFWDWYAARARKEPATVTEPWWRSRQPLVPLVTPAERAPDKNVAATGQSVPAAQAKAEPTAPQPQPAAAAPPAAPPVPESATPEDAWWRPSH